jgi:hypothetical protein
MCLAHDSLSHDSFHTASKLPRSFNSIDHRLRVFRRAQLNEEAETEPLSYIRVCVAICGAISTPQATAYEKLELGGGMELRSHIAPAKVIACAFVDLRKIVPLPHLDQSGHASADVAP